MSNISLRPWKPEDAQALAAIANNRNIWNNLRDQLPHPYTVSDAQDWIAHCRSQKPVLNFAVVYNTQVAGSIGCVPKADVYSKNMEIGYFIGEHFWSKGIATKAVHILLEYIQKNFSVVRIYAEVFAHNKTSMRVLQKNGFYLESIRRCGAYKNKKIIDDYVWVKLV
jgi:RimJ/RimL family protein N-acetyltransferase